MGGRGWGTRREGGKVKGDERMGCSEAMGSKWVPQRPGLRRRVMNSLLELA